MNSLYTAMMLGAMLGLKSITGHADPTTKGTTISTEVAHF